jgi:ethanolamine utilization protein EutM
VSEESLGLVETYGLIPAIEASDAMVKAAHVTLQGMEHTVAALVTVQVTGETGAVQSAVAAGVAAAEKVGRVVAHHVIARPDTQMADMQRSDRTQATQPRPQGAALEFMTVEELRRLARGQPDFPLQGREISRANKETLLKYFRGSN